MGTNPTRALEPKNLPGDAPYEIYRLGKQILFDGVELIRGQTVNVPTLKVKQYLDDGLIVRPPMKRHILRADVEPAPQPEKKRKWVTVDDMDSVPDITDEPDVPESAGVVAAATESTGLRASLAVTGNHEVKRTRRVTRARAGAGKVTSL